MSQQILEQLEEKIDQAIEVIQLMRMQVEELEEKTATLQHEGTTLHRDNAALKNKQVLWEHSLSTLLNKLEGVTVASNKSALRSVEHTVSEEALA